MKLSPEARALAKRIGLSDEEIACVESTDYEAIARVSDVLKPATHKVLRDELAVLLMKNGGDEAAAIDSAYRLILIMSKVADEGLLG